MDELSEAEYEFVQWYRTLCDKHKLAVRRYLYLGDASLLRGFGENCERLDRVRRLSATQRNDKRSLFGA